ncbi:MAG: TonB-dependent receptor, partial [bacterium]|nr:TonB-dependent receptor [bacterium]
MPLRPLSLKWVALSAGLLAATAFPALADDAEPTPEYIALNDSTFVPVYEMDAVVVTGSRTEQRLADVTVATELIGREELARSGSPDLADFLSKASGVAVSQTIFGSGIQLQGLGSEYVLILVNGERTLGRMGGVIDLTRFSTDNVERIEVVK